MSRRLPPVGSRDAVPMPSGRDGGRSPLPGFRPKRVGTWRQRVRCRADRPGEWGAGEGFWGELWWNAPCAGDRQRVYCLGFNELMMSSRHLNTAGASASIATDVNAYRQDGRRVSAQPAERGTQFPAER